MVEYKDTTIQILKSTDKESDKVFDNVNHLIFVALVNMYIRYFYKNKKPEINVEKSTLKDLLDKYILDEENNNLYNKYISNISNIYPKKENNDAKKLSDMTLKSYFKEIFKNKLKDKNKPKKYIIAEGMIERILKIIKCLIKEQGKIDKDVLKIDNKNIDNIKKDNINQNALKYFTK